MRPVPQYRNGWRTLSLTKLGKKAQVAVSNSLKTTILAYEAISQRGKGGVYRALDISVSPIRLCVLKEGRKDGKRTGMVAVIVSESGTLVPVDFEGPCPVNKPDPMLSRAIPSAAGCHRWLSFEWLPSCSFQVQSSCSSGPFSAPGWAQTRPSGLIPVLGLRLPYFTSALHSLTS